MHREQERTNLQISDHAAVDKAVLIGHADHVSLPGGELRQRRRPVQTPRDIPEFTGRRDIIDTITDSLSRATDTPKIWILSGMAGVGKTSVAIRVANKFSEKFPDGILFANLAGASTSPADVTEVLVRFLKDLGISLADIPSDYQSLVTAYRTLIATKSILVILDDAADTRQVNDLLPTSANSAALVTSRRPLSTLPGAEGIPVDIWTPGECFDFLKILLGAARVTEDSEAVRELADICGRLPIALRVIAAQLIRRPLWPITRMVGRLRDEQRRLAVLQADDIAIRSVFGTAYDSLNDEQSRIFQSVGLTLSVDFCAESVAKLADIDEYAAEDLLEDLADRHLISLEETPGRYRIHDLMHLFAKEKAEESYSNTEKQGAIHRLLHWHLDVLRAYGPPTRTWVRLERRSLVAGVLVAAAHEWDEICWETANELANYHSSDGDYIDWITCNKAGLIAARRCGSREGEALMLGGLGQASVKLNKLNEARAYLEASLQAFRGLNDLHRCVEILWEIGNTASKQWDVARAVSAYTDSVEMAISLKSPYWMARGFHALGHLYSGLRRYDEALRCFEQELELAAQNDGGAGHRGIAYQGMAACLAAGGMREKAIESYDRAIAEARETTDAKSLRIRLTRKAGVLQRLERHQEADSTYREALSLARESQDSAGIAWILHKLADAREAQGRFDESDALYAEILAMDEIGDDPAGLVNTLHCWADSYIRRGDLDRANELLEKSHSSALQHEVENQLIQVLLCRSSLEKKRQDLSSALSFTRDAVGVARSYGSARLLARCLRHLGRLLEANSQERKALEAYEEQFKLELLMQQKEASAKTAEEIVRLMQTLGMHEEAKRYSS